MSDARNWDAEGSRLAGEAAADGEPTRWFEELWSAAARDEVDLPWDRTAPYPPVLALVDAAGDAPGRHAVVVGAGLGADAELLASRGYRTVAFDLAPSAVDLARARYPRSAVDYRVADLLDLPADLLGAFDLVVDVFTVQALPRQLRSRAVDGIRSLLAPGGELLAVQFVHEDDAPEDDGPPWLVTRAEMESFAAGDVALVSLSRGPHPLRPGGPDAWVGLFRRSD
ncbi:MAG: class I SAM-dependent methyltransferase [Ornithinibacter sp.]